MDVDQVLDDFDPDEAQPEMWNQIAAQVEQDRCDEGNLVDDPTHTFCNPDLVQADHITTESRRTASRHNFSLTSTHSLSDPDYLNMLRSLNAKQGLFFDFVYQWATETNLAHQHNQKPPDPFYIFLSGGAGVGKTHTVNSVYQAAVRALHQAGQNPDKPTVLMTASTGKAVANINGKTLHSAFSLPVKQKGSEFKYRKPSAEKLNILRCNYVNVKLIIADEISMFGSKSPASISDPSGYF